MNNDWKNDFINYHGTKSNKDDCGGGGYNYSVIITIIYFKKN